VLPDTLTPRWSVVLAVLTALTVAVLTMVSVPSTLGDPGSGTSASTPTKAGPVSATDRVLLVALRQHELWATPVTQQATQMATSPALRELGGSFASDLDSLSDQVREVANRLGVALPSQPTSEQQNWAAQISGKSGSDYDRTMVSRLRADCAATAELIDRARTETRNEQIRQLTDQAAGMVARLLTYLDRYQAGGDPAPDVTTAAPAPVLSAAAAPRPDSDHTMLAVTALVVLTGALTAIRIARRTRIPRASRGR
jgi:putative membrane protein